jgi:hypothetical protein
VEFIKIKPATIKESSVSKPEDPDAICIIGRNNSVFVLEGSHKDIKDWTSRDTLPAVTCQGFTPAGSFLVLLLVFSAIPNGSAMDQLAFILLDALGQINVLVR